MEVPRGRQSKVPHGGHRGSKPLRATENGNGAPREAHSDLGGTRWLSVISVWNLLPPLPRTRIPGRSPNCPVRNRRGRRLPRCGKSANRLRSGQIACRYPDRLAPTPARAPGTHPAREGDRCVRLREAAGPRRAAHRRRGRTWRRRNDIARSEQSQRRSACRHGCVADRRDHRPRLRLRQSGRDACLRARWPHHLAAWRRCAAAAGHLVDRHGAPGVPAGRGGRRRREGDDRRRAVRTLPDGTDLRLPQLARPRCRHRGGARRCRDGLRFAHRTACDRPFRPRRAAASDARSDGRLGASAARACRRSSRATSIRWMRR